MKNYKTRYQERKATGLCTRCGKKPALDNKVQCAECDDYYANRRSKLTDDQRANRKRTHQEWAKGNKDKISARDNRYREKLKNEILSHYGTSCACCGESAREFLTLDHVNGGGNKNRIELLGKPQAGNAFYRKIRVLGFPDGFQTLCWNCNMAKAHYGICPHQNAK